MLTDFENYPKSMNRNNFFSSNTKVSLTLLRFSHGLCRSREYNVNEEEYDNFIHSDEPVYLYIFDTSTIARKIYFDFWIIHCQ